LSLPFCRQSVFIVPTSIKSRGHFIHDKKLFIYGNKMPLWPRFWGRKRNMWSPYGDSIACAHFFVLKDLIYGIYLIHFSLHDRHIHVTENHSYIWPYLPIKLLFNYHLPYWKTFLLNVLKLNVELNWIELKVIWDMVCNYKSLLK